MSQTTMASKEELQQRPFAAGASGLAEPSFTGRTQSSVVVGGSRLDEHPFLQTASWKKFVRWVRFCGSLDPYRLSQHIQQQLLLSQSGGRRPATSLEEPDRDKKIFDRMLVLLAVYDAAIPNPVDREELADLADQTSRLFQFEWRKLCDDLDDGTVERLKDTVRDKLLGRFRTLPNMIIGTLHAKPVGTRSLSEMIPRRAMECSDRPAVGLPLYQSTLETSARARMADFNVEFELNSLAYEGEEDGAAPAKIHVADEDEFDYKPLSMDDE